MAPDSSAGAAAAALHQARKPSRDLGVDSLPSRPSFAGKKSAVARRGHIRANYGSPSI